LARDSVGGNEGKRRWRRLEEEGGSDMRARGVSDGGGSKACARVSWANGGSLGSAVTP
jgi:hypothetical protein